MSAPNIVNVSTITGKSAAANLTTQSTTSIVSNDSSSGKVVRIISLVVANCNTTADTQVTVAYHDAASAGGNATSIANNITVPKNASLVVIDKNTPFYLEENTSISVKAASANDLTAMASFEEIS